MYKERSATGKSADSRGVLGQAGMHQLFPLLTQSSISWDLNKDIDFSGNVHGMAVGLVVAQSSHQLSSQ